MKKFNFNEYKKKVNKKEIRKDVINLTNKLEGVLFESKKWVVVVIMPTIEILINIASLLNNNNGNDEDKWY